MFGVFPGDVRFLTSFSHARHCHVPHGAVLYVCAQSVNVSTTDRRAEGVRLYLASAVCCSAWLAPTPGACVGGDVGPPSNVGPRVTTTVVPLQQEASVLCLVLGDKVLEPTSSRHGLILDTVFQAVVGHSTSDDVVGVDPRSLRRATALFANDTGVVVDLAHRHAQMLANVPQTAPAATVISFASAGSRQQQHGNVHGTTSSTAAQGKRKRKGDAQTHGGKRTTGGQASQQSTSSPGTNAFCQSMGVVMMMRVFFLFFFIGVTFYNPRLCPPPTVPRRPAGHCATQQRRANQTR